ncbi:YbaB/EbfC family nucleoid-associated protein [Candidatus Uhrbacteria bacterium]|nr:YbaB/EbfC family nucleoid-associated protein [Candidatus Uhrbacteria bacterium]
MFNKLKQFKDLRDKAKGLQSELATITDEGSAGWGKVKVTVNGNQDIQSVSIDQSAMDNREKLEGLVKDAVNDAMKKIKTKMAKKLQEMGGPDLAKEFGDLIK